MWVILYVAAGVVGLVVLYLLIKRFGSAKVQAPVERVKGVIMSDVNKVYRFNSARIAKLREKFARRGGNSKPRK